MSTAAAERRAETQRANLDRWALEMESKLDAGLLSTSAWSHACDGYFARLAEIEADLAAATMRPQPPAATRSTRPAAHPA